MNNLDNHELKFRCNNGHNGHLSKESKGKVLMVNDTSINSMQHMCEKKLNGFQGRAIGLSVSHARLERIAIHSQIVDNVGQERAPSLIGLVLPQEEVPNRNLQNMNMSQQKNISQQVIRLVVLETQMEEVFLNLKPFDNLSAIKLIKFFTVTKSKEELAHLIGLSSLAHSMQVQCVCCYFSVLAIFSSSSSSF